MKLVSYAKERWRLTLPLSNLQQCFSPPPVRDIIYHPLRMSRLTTETDSCVQHPGRQQRVQLSAERVRCREVR